MIGSLALRRNNNVPMVIMLIVLISTATSHAGFVLSRGEFYQAATGTIETLDFEGLVGTEDFPNNYPHGDGWWTESGMVDLYTTHGLQFSAQTWVGDDIVSNEIYLMDNVPYYSLNGTANLAMGRTYGYLYSPLMEENARTAIGFDVCYSSDGVTGTVGGNCTIEVHFWDDTEPAVMSTSGLDTVEFIGYVSEHPILFIDLHTGGGRDSRYILMDDVVYNPEPTTMLLLSLGITLLTRRRYTA